MILTESGPHNSLTLFKNARSADDIISLSFHYHEIFTLADQIKQHPGLAPAPGKDTMQRIHRLRPRLAQSGS